MESSLGYLESLWTKKIPWVFEGLTKGELHRESIILLKIIKKQRGTHETLLGEKIKWKQRFVFVYNKEMVVVSWVTLEHGTDLQVYLPTPRRTFPMSLTQHSSHQSSLSQSHQVKSSYLCSREVTLYRPFTVISFWVSHPQVIFSHISYPHTSNDVSFRLIRDRSIPSFSEYVPIDINTLSGNLI